MGIQRPERESCCQSQDVVQLWDAGWRPELKKPSREAGQFGCLNALSRGSGEDEFGFNHCANAQWE